MGRLRERAGVAPTSAAVRWLHVLGMAVALGGAVLAWGVAGRTSGDARGPPLAVARTYEVLFWGAAGVLVMTGVGNLGARAPAIPGVDTRWGTILAAKLLAVLGLLGLSLLRTLVVHRVRVLAAGTPVGGRLLRAGYGLTALYLLGLLALAVVLAHG